MYIIYVNDLKHYSKYDLQCMLCSSCLVSYVNLAILGRT